MNSSSWASPFGFDSATVPVPVCPVVDVDPAVNAGLSEDESSMRRRLLGRGVGASLAP